MSTVCVMKEDELWVSVHTCMRCARRIACRSHRQIVPLRLNEKDTDIHTHKYVEMRINKKRERINEKNISENNNIEGIANSAVIRRGPTPNVLSSISSAILFLNVLSISETLLLDEVLIFVSVCELKEEEEEEDDDDDEDDERERSRREKVMAVMGERWAERGESTGTPRSTSYSTTLPLASVREREINK